MTTQKGPISIAKRLGIAVTGVIDQQANDSNTNFKAGSVFSNMASLPPTNFEKYDCNYEAELQSIKK